MLRSIAFISFLLTACSFSQIKEASCNPTLEEQGKSFYLKPTGDSLQLIKSGDINGKDWITFLLSNHLASGSKIIDCSTGKEIVPKYWSYDISYRNKRFVIQSHKDFWAFHESKKDWVGPLEVDTYSEEIYATNNSILKTAPVLILHPPYYSNEAKAKLNNEFEKYVRDNIPASNYLLLNRLLVAALNGDTLSRTRLLSYRQKFPKPNIDESIDENIRLLHDYEEWLSKGGQRVFLTSEEYPILK